MHIYISLAHLALALAFCGGFFAGRAVLTYRLKKAIDRDVSNHWQDHYRAKYNEQMNQLCSHYKQERKAFIQQYEGLAAELEREIEWLKAGCDPDKTNQSYPGCPFDDIDDELEEALA